MRSGAPRNRYAFVDVEWTLVGPIYGAAMQQKFRSVLAAHGNATCARARLTTTSHWRSTGNRRELVQPPGFLRVKDSAIVSFISSCFSSEAPTGLTHVVRRSGN